MSSSRAARSQRIDAPEAAGELRVLRSNSPPAQPSSFVVGTIVDVDALGVPLVDFAGNVHGPLPARTSVQIEPGTPAASIAGARVLLCFELADRRLPIIAGFVHDSISAGSGESRGEAIVDGKVVRLTGRERVELRCGDSAITLFADGRIIVKGRNLVSRASEANKIRGASVQIN